MPQPFQHRVHTYFTRADKQQQHTPSTMHAKGTRDTLSLAHMQRGVLTPLHACVRAAKKQHPSHSSVEQRSLHTAALPSLPLIWPQHAACALTPSAAQDTSSKWNINAARHKPPMQHQHFGMLSTSGVCNAAHSAVLQKPQSTQAQT